MNDAAWWVQLVEFLVIPIVVRVAVHFLPWLAKDVPGTSLDDPLNGKGGGSGE